MAHCPIAGCIQVSAATRALLTTHTFTPTGGVEVKGKGLMETYLWIPEEHPEEEYKTVREQAQVGMAPGGRVWVGGRPRCMAGLVLWGVFAELAR